MMNGVQSLPQWQKFMNHPTGAWLGFINAVMTLGGFITLPLQARTADHFGRRCCLCVGMIFCALGTALQTAATNQAMFILGRFFIGVSTAWFSITVVLISEIAYPSHRAKVTALYQCQYCMRTGQLSILVGLTNYRHWKHSFCLVDIWSSKYEELLGMAHTVAFASRHAAFRFGWYRFDPRIPTLVGVERPRRRSSVHCC